MGTHQNKEADNAPPDVMEMLRNDGALNNFKETAPANIEEQSQKVRNSLFGVGKKVKMVEGRLVDEKTYREEVFKPVIDFNTEQMKEATIDVKNIKPKAKQFLQTVEFDVGMAPPPSLRPLEKSPPRKRAKKSKHSKGDKRQRSDDSDDASSKKKPKESSKERKERKKEEKEEKKAQTRKAAVEEMYPAVLKEYVNRQLIGKMPDDARKEIRGTVCKHLVRILGGKQPPEFWEPFCTKGNNKSKRKVKEALVAAQEERDAPEPGLL